MSPEVRIRPAGREDVHIFLGLIDAHADFEELPRPTQEARERLVRDGFGDDPRFFAHLASVDGEDVGYAITYEAYSSFLARPTLFLEDIYIRSDQRGVGVGGVMFGYLAAEALRRGCGRMEWMVVEWNENAIAFYERRGAEQLDWRIYRLEGDSLRAAASYDPEEEG